MGRTWTTVLAQFATLAVVLIAVSVPARAQEHVWSRAFGSSGAGAWTTGVSADSTGEVFAGGCFDHAVSFGGSTFAANGTDGFLGKYGASDGRHRWSVHFTGGTTVCVASVAVDTDRNVFVTGNFDQNLAAPFGPFSTRGGPDIFLAKLSGVDGRVLWSVQLGGPGSDKPAALAIDSNDNVIVTGFFTRTAEFGGTEHTSAGASDIFLATYSGSNGGLLWSRAVGGPGSEAGSAVSILTNGNIAVAGKFEDEVDFGGGTLASAGWDDIFVAIYRANGSHVWSRAIGAFLGDVANGVGTDSAGNVVITGAIYDLVDFGAGLLGAAERGSIYLAKYRGGDGAHVWSNAYPAPISNGEIANALAVDDFDNIVITGSISGRVDFGGGPLGDSFSTDIFVAEFAGNGTHLWSGRYGGSLADRGLGAATDASGNVIIGGKFPESVDFGGGILRSPGGTAAFVVKFANDSVPAASPTRTSPPTNTPQPPATPTRTPTPTFAPIATSTSVPTPQPTNTSVPTFTPTPALTHTPIATATPTASSPPASAEIVGQVHLEGRPTPPHGYWIMTGMEVSLTNPATGTEEAVCNTITDSSGVFRCPNLPTGSFTACVKHFRSLKNCRPVQLDLGENEIDFGRLLEGDADNDNSVQLVDFSILSGSFAKCVGPPDYDQRADFSNDGCVVQVDFSLLSTNFGEMGEEATGGAAGSAAADEPFSASISARAAGQAASSMTVSAPPTAMVDEEFNVIIRVEAGEQPVDGAAAYLGFDPEVLQVIDAKLGTALSEELARKWDNSTGIVEVAAGQLGGPQDSFPDGTFELATLTLRALHPATSTSLSLKRDATWWSDVTFKGESILGSLHDTELNVLGETSTPTCAGDCNQDGQVTVDEVLNLVNTALDGGSTAGCSAGDVNGDGSITIDEIIAATNAALDGCVQSSGS